MILISSGRSFIFFVPVQGLCCPQISHRHAYLTLYLFASNNVSAIIAETVSERVKTEKRLDFFIKILKEESFLHSAGGAQVFQEEIMWKPSGFKPPEMCKCKRETEADEWLCWLIHCCSAYTLQRACVFQNPVWSRDFHLKSSPLAFGFLNKAFRLGLSIPLTPGWA